MQSKKLLFFLKEMLEQVLVFAYRSVCHGHHAGAGWLPYAHGAAEDASRIQVSLRSRRWLPRQRNVLVNYRVHFFYCTDIYITMVLLQEVMLRIASRLSYDTLHLNECLDRREIHSSLACEISIILEQHFAYEYT